MHPILAQSPRADVSSQHAEGSCANLPSRKGRLADHIYPLPLLINYWQKSLKCPPVCKCFKTHLQIKLTSSGCYVHEIMNSLEISEAITCHIEILSCLSALIWRNSLKLLFLVASLRKM